MGKLLFEEGKRYRFSDYYELGNPTEEVAEAFGYRFETKALKLPCAADVDAEIILSIQAGFYEVLPKIALNSEMAKREFMIAPVLWGVLRHADAKIMVEYPIHIDDRLGGSLDYLLRSTQEIVVIEAKKGDLDKGFNQLAVELIALDNDQDDKARPPIIYGAISIGELWRFGLLERRTKHIIRDLHTYRVPEDLAQVFLSILGILRQP